MGMMNLYRYYVGRENTLNQRFLKTYWVSDSSRLSKEMVRTLLSFGDFYHTHENWTGSFLPN